MHPTTVAAVVALGLVCPALSEAQVYAFQRSDKAEGQFITDTRNIYVNIPKFFNEYRGGVENWELAFMSDAPGYYACAVVSVRSGLPGAGTRPKYFWGKGAKTSKEAMDDAFAQAYAHQAGDKTLSTASCRTGFNANKYPLDKHFKL